MTVRRVAWLVCLLVAASVVSAVPAVADVPTGSCASHVSGDFDGDGNSDLAVGVPGQDVDGDANAGAVNVIYGTSTGLEITDDQLITQDSQGVNDRTQPGDRFGSCLAAGDFNNDGQSDLAIGVPREGVEGAEDAGAVNVIYGTATGLDAFGPPGDDFWHQNSSGVGGFCEDEDGFGSSLAAGDFDGDGYDDLAIGVPFEEIVDIVDAGAINVLYGNNGGLSTTGQQLWYENVSGVADTSERRDEFGASLAAGDADDDGQDDLAIGTPGERVSSRARAGAVHVMYSGSSGLDTNGDRLWHQDSSGVEDTSESQDRFGTAVALGDFDADGDDDLAVGTPSEDVGVLADAGAVNVLNGSSTGITGAGDLFITQDGTSPADGSEVGDVFGSSLAAAQFENDGEADDDLAIGAPGEDAEIGAVEVVYGDDPNGLDPAAVTTDRFTQDTADVGDTGEPGDGFGAALVAGDYSDDAIFDLTIGVPGEDVNAQSNAGAVNVIYGAAAGLDPSISPDEFWHQDVAGIADDAEPGDRFGAALG